jgi:hypothetical protein
MGPVKDVPLLSTAKDVGLPVPVPVPAANLRIVSPVEVVVPIA